MRIQKNFRMRFTAIFVLLWMTLGFNSVAAEEKFPERPIEMIIGFNPGGGTDAVMRVIAEALPPFLGQKLVIINRPGAGGVIGVTAVAQAKPDGYTIGGTNNAALTISPFVTNVSYTIDDFAFLCQVSSTPGVFCVQSDFPFKDAKEFFEDARKNPNKYSYGCDGVGGLTHFMAERIFSAMKVKLRVVPFGGAAETMKALLGRHIDIYGGSTPPALPHVKKGTIRGFFATSLEDLKEFPGTMGLTTLGHPEAAMLQWRGVIAPKGIPEERRAILEKAFLSAAKTETVQNSIKNMAEQIVASSGKEFEKYLRSEYKENEVISKEIGLKK